MLEDVNSRLINKPERRSMEKPISWECLICGRDSVWPSESSDPRVILAEIRKFHAIASHNFIGFECASKLVVFISPMAPESAKPEKKEAAIDIITDNHPMIEK
jgi:hypothetical protein